MPAKKTTPRTRAERIKQAAADAEAFARGALKGARITTPGMIVKRLRARLGLTQTEFAARFNLPVATIRDWEQDRRKPEGSAVALLRVIAYAPDVVEKALAKEAA